MTDYEAVIRRLARSGVEFIIVGGMAAVLHGSARLTQDLDVVYRRTPDNIGRLAKCLRDVNPYLRGAPAGLPFHLDADTIRHGLNFTLTTDLPLSKLPLWQQNDNVPFEQSRNVLLTAPNFGDARRTTTDDSNR